MLTSLSCDSHPNRSRVPIVIGLINNMGPKAAKSTENQFCSLIAAAARERAVGLKVFSISAIEDEDAVSSGSYGDFAALQAARIDGLIITGASPTTPDLRDEPSWPMLTQLVDFARARQIPCIWSCLAAHAAVLHLHGIAKRALPRKLSGLVECVRTESSHPILADIPVRWSVPQSRYNDLPVSDLIANGYDILSGSPSSGVDTFTYDEFGSFVFFQGHPEYLADTLLREYRRDVGAFLAGVRNDYPDIPFNYLQPHSVALLERYREQALDDRRSGLLERFPFAECGNVLSASWHQVAVRVCKNWLQIIDAASSGRRPTGETDLRN